MSPEDQDRELFIERLKGTLVFWSIFLSMGLILYGLGSGVICLLEWILEVIRQ